MPTLFQISTSINSGSIGRIAEEIGQLSINNNWKSFIAYGRNYNLSKSNSIKIGTNFDVKLHYIQSTLFDMHGFGSTNATKKMINKLDEIKPDIIHLHNIHGYYINIEILFNYLAKLHTRIVWTFHDCWSITGHCAHFDYVGCNKWVKGCNHCPQKKEYPTSWFIDSSKRNYQMKKSLFTSVGSIVIVPVSHWISYIISSSFLKDFPKQVIHNGINTDLFCPQTKDVQTRAKYNIGDRFIILGVANPWNNKKGLNDFIELSKWLGNDLVIILIGLNKKQLKKLPNNIMGFEKTEDISQLIELYSAADVFVNPTWEDNFPTTNLEALACGTPVITYRTGGSIESISIETGFIVEKGDIAGIVDAIKKIKSIGKNIYSDKCILSVKKYFDKNDRFMDYINLYNSLI